MIEAAQTGETRIGLEQGTRWLEIERKKQIHQIFAKEKKKSVANRRQRNAGFYLYELIGQHLKISFLCRITDQGYRDLCPETRDMVFSKS